MIAPALKIHPNTGPPWLVAIGKWLGFLVPFLKVAKVKSEYVSRRADVVEFYKTTVKEKYGDNGGSTAGFGLRLLTEQDRLLNEKV
jgi:acylglycerol lipase